MQVHADVNVTADDLAAAVIRSLVERTKVNPADIEDMCRKLLANTVIENFRIERLETA